MLRLVTALQAFLWLCAATLGCGSQATGSVPLLLSTTRIPGVVSQSFSFDSSTFDSQTELYYVSDISNRTVDVLDGRDGSFVGSMPGFAQGFQPGPNGIRAIGPLLYVGDGDSTVKVFDLASRTLRATIATGGTQRARAIGYDPTDQLLVVTNGDDTPPFLSFVSTATKQVVGMLVVNDALGLDSPVWRASTNEVFVAVKPADPFHKGRVVTLDPATKAIKKTFTLDGCNAPTGLAFGPNDKLLVGCGTPLCPGPCQNADSMRTLILDPTDGHVVANIDQVGGTDQVWFNPGDNRFYLAASHFTTDGTVLGVTSPMLGIVDAMTNSWIANIPTTSASHTVAVDPKNNHVFVPYPDGVNIYGPVP